MTNLQRFEALVVKMSLLRVEGVSRAEWALKEIKRLTAENERLTKENEKLRNQIDEMSWPFPD